MHHDLFQRAQRRIPGGVNSPVRAFKSVGGDPVFIRSAQGPYLNDVEGKRYIDFVGSWGPMILGHDHPAVREAVVEAAAKGLSFGACTEAEVEMAELLCALLPSMEKVRLVNSGTEATMSAVRLARGFTGREKFIKFRGCYHGHGDSFLIEAGSGALTFGQPSSPGVTEGAARDTLLADYNDLASVEALFAANPGGIAALIVEPVPGNMGVVPPAPGFLEGLRSLCDREGALLIFDEVMTGFRLSLQGAQGLYGIRPDLTTLGKVIGGGMPVGAYGGRADIMDRLSPAGPVYQAGTLSGNPLATAAGLAMLREISKPGFYDSLERHSAYWEAGLKQALAGAHLPFTVNRVGSMLTLFFAPAPVNSFTAALRSDTQAYGRFFRGMLNRGVYLAPSQFEAAFLSAAHTEALLDQVAEAVRATVQEL